MSKLGHDPLAWLVQDETNSGSVNTQENTENIENIENIENKIDAIKLSGELEISRLGDVYSQLQTLWNSKGDVKIFVQDLERIDGASLHKDKLLLPH